MPLASVSGSTRPEGAQMPMTPGSGSARGSRGVRSRAIELGSAAMDFLERDQVAVGIPYHEPARAPVGVLGLPHHVPALGQPLEALVDVVDVEVHVGSRRAQPLLGGALGLALADDHLDAAAGERHAAALALAAPLARHRP